MEATPNADEILDFIRNSSRGVMKDTQEIIKKAIGSWLLSLNLKKNI
jgi:hypothetical protein